MAEAAMAASHLKDPALAAGSCHSGDGGGGRQCSLRRLSGLGFRTKRKETLSPSSSRAASSSPFFWTCHCSSSSFPPNLLLQVLFLILVCFALPAASHADGTTCLNVEQKPPKRFLYDTAELRILPLVLDSSERITHRVTTEILKILLQEILGYQNVTIKVFKDVFNMTANLGRLSAEKSGRGKQPVGMINIEVWVPPGVGRADHTLLDAIDCGPHRSGGRFGWYVTKNNDTETKIADYWRSFKKMSVASLLALTNEEEELVKKLTVNPNGEYYCQDNCDEGIFKPPLCREGKDCATLFVRDYEASSFLRDQILRLQLMIQVAWIGPNLTPHFVRTFRGSKAILFFDWWPNEFSNLQGFLPVAFAQSSEFLKKYELHSLNKFVWKKLQSNGKTAVELTQRMVFNEMDYRFILQRYTSITANMTHPLPSKRNDALINSIACEWLQKNKSVWLGWRPQDYNRKTTLWVGGIFPMTGPSFESRTLLRPAQMAQHKINLDPNILPDVKFEILASNGKCKSDDVLRAFISYIRMDNTNPKYKFNNMVGILGPACSDTVEPLAGVALHFHTVIISYSAEGAIFNDKNKYPFFFRTIPENRLFRFVYLQIFQRNNWKKVASLSEDGNKYSEYLTLLENVLERFNITIFNRRFPRNLETSDKSDVNSYLTSLKKNNHRIIIGDFYASKARLILCEAYKRNMTIKHGFVWFLPRWFSSNWYNTRGIPNINCTTAQMLEALDGHLSLGYSYFSPGNTTFRENRTVDEWMEEYRERYDGESPADYAGYTYDAMWTYALALDKLLKENHTYMANLHNKNTNARFVKLLEQTDFMGVSGHIKFEAGPSRESSVDVYQFRAVDNMTGRYTTVGYFMPNSREEKGGELHLNDSKIKWFTADGLPPTDGSPPPQTCALALLSEALGGSCEFAIVVAMMIGFGVFAIFLAVLFIVYKKRYERMLPNKPEWVMRDLDQWEVPRERVVINRKIGEGAFGTVHGGECFLSEERGWVAVAVKTLKFGSTMDERLDFLVEAEMMKRFDHTNMVKLLGLCTREEPVYTIMEFMLYGDLKTYLLARRHLVAERSNRDDDDEVSNRRLTSVALDIASALAYLAENQYVHRDLACRNCLVNADRVVKLSDFGMTRPVYENDYYRFNRKGMLPVRWMAPESLEEGIYTPQSDIWSYGVLMYEIVTFGSFPFRGLSNNKVVEIVTKGTTLSIPPGVKPELEKLFFRCWSKTASLRPSAEEICEVLKNSPQLITPSLDVPSAAVEMNDNEAVDFNIPEQPGRRLSAPNTRAAPTQARLRIPSGTDSTNVTVTALPVSPTTPPDNTSRPRINSHNSVNYSNLANLDFNNPDALTNLSNTTVMPANNPLFSNTRTNLSNTSIMPVNNPLLSTTGTIHFENGSGASTAPLLPQNGDAYITRYARLQCTK